VRRHEERQAARARDARRSGVQKAVTTWVDAVEVNYVIQVRYCLATIASNPESVNCSLSSIAYTTYLD
jgi:hypothetical protein